MIARLADRARPLSRPAAVLSTIALAIAGVGLFVSRAPSLVLAPALALPADSMAEWLAADTMPLDPTTLYGRSGKLRLRLFMPDAAFTTAALGRLVGGTAANEPGVYAADTAGLPHSLSVATLRPFATKLGGYVGTYHVGFWPAEQTAGQSELYENPVGFIVVTEENQDTPVSEHFRLRDFLTHDQKDVWPKYLVLREELVDKLELVIEELGKSGTPVTRMRVMSGFRTPQYNAAGLAEGRARNSRHQYGDAADVLVDNNGDGGMDDLNRDGVVDTRDIDLVTAAVDRVEFRHPTLVGGLGRYHAMGPNGPFAHVDVRGYRARWGNLPRVAAARRPASGAATVAGSRPGQPGRAAPPRPAKCEARGASAILCFTMRRRS